MSWSDWAAGVLTDLGAPTNQTNFDTLWAWSNAETAPYDLMRWNNPLNTTWKLPDSFNSGAQPGAHDVQVYPSVADGITATVLTLAQPYYPTILSHLRNATPRQDWGDACTELGLWGTGCRWIALTYSAAPHAPIGDEMTAEQEAILRQALAAINDVNGGLFYPETDPSYGSFAKLVNDKIRTIVQQELAKLPAPTITVPTQITFSGTGSMK